MKKNFFLLLFAVCFIKISGYCQDCVYYEYKITSEKENSGISGLLKCFNLNGNSRVKSTLKIPGMPKSLTRLTSLSVNEKPNVVFMLIPSGKMFSEISFAEFSEAGKPKEDYDINFMGNEVINGYNAIHIISKYSSGKLKAEMWISKSVPGFAHYLISKANKFFNDEEFFKLISEKGIEGIPVRIKTAEGDNVLVFDLVTAEKRETTEAFFEVPAGYTQTTSAKLSTVENVIEDMQNMTPEEAKVFMQQLKLKYGLE